MNRDDLLLSIAEAGYNVGFGAKKHFATFDMASKLPGVIGYAALVVGVFALFIDWFTNKILSATLIVLGILAITITPYNHRKEEYAKAGRKLTESFNALKSLYVRVKGSPSTASLDTFLDELRAIETQSSSVAIPDQMLLSDWYAHYKFFWQHQIGWIDEQKHFKFWRDKVPLSFMLVAIAMALVLAALLIHWRAVLCAP